MRKFWKTGTVAYDNLAGQPLPVSSQLRAMTALYRFNSDVSSMLGCSRGHAHYKVASETVDISGQCRHPWDLFSGLPLGCSLSILHNCQERPLGSEGSTLYVVNVYVLGSKAFRIGGMWVYLL